MHELFVKTCKDKKVTNERLQNVHGGIKSEEIYCKGQ
jgi:hypothetical protein